MAVPIFGELISYYLPRGEEAIFSKK